MVAASLALVLPDSITAMSTPVICTWVTLAFALGLNCRLHFTTYWEKPWQRHTVVCRRCPWHWHSHVGTTPGQAKTDSCSTLYHNLPDGLSHSASQELLGCCWKEQCISCQTVCPRQGGSLTSLGDGTIPKGEVGLTCDRGLGLCAGVRGWPSWQGSCAAPCSLQGAPSPSPCTCSINHQLAKPSKEAPFPSLSHTPQHELNENREFMEVAKPLGCT